MKDMPKSMLRRLAESIFSAGTLRLMEKWRKLYWHWRGRLFDEVAFRFLLIWWCAKSRRRAVLFHRHDALGDVVCTLPMCLEVRRRHPDAIIVFLTFVAFKPTVELSSVADEVYGVRSKGLRVSEGLLGLVKAVYAPFTTDERSMDGPTCHLITDLSNSCGILLSAPQPKLYPSLSLIEITIKKYALEQQFSPGRIVIGINGGHSWPVKEWEASKWQVLVNLVHANYDAVILQFGLSQGAGDPNDKLEGVISLVSRLASHELVALVACCDLVISIDSGPIHIAGAVETPVIGLFGANDGRYRLPLKSFGMGVCGDVPCLFCHHKTPRGHWQTNCPNDILCMKVLDSASVFNVVKAVLSKELGAGRTKIALPPHAQERG